MSLEKSLNRAVETFLREENKKVALHNPVYQEAIEFLKRFGYLQLRALRENTALPEEVLKIVLEGAEKKRLELQRKNPLLQLSVLVNKETELYLPIKRNLGERTDIEHEIYQYVLEQAYLLDSNPLSGEIGDFASLYIHDSKAGRLNLKGTPESFRTAGISFLTEGFSIPQVRGDYKFPLKTVRISMTPSAIEYSLIPLRGSYREFFPEYKVPFDIVSPIGTFSAWVTSQPKEGGRGQYICGSSHDGMMRKVFEDMELSQDSEVEMSELIKKSRYDIRKV